MSTSCERDSIGRENFGWWTVKPKKVESSNNERWGVLVVHVYPKLGERLSHFTPDKLWMTWKDERVLISSEGRVVVNNNSLDFNIEENVKDVERLGEFVELAKKTKNMKRTNGSWKKMEDLLNDEDGKILNQMMMVELREDRKGKLRTKVRRFLVIDPKNISVGEKLFLGEMNDLNKEISGVEVSFEECLGVFGEEYGGLIDGVLAVTAKRRAEKYTEMILNVSK